MNNIAKPAHGETQGENPCTRCDRGWGSIGIDGVTSCKDDCEKFKKYREAKPRICEVLGVEDMEPFRFAGIGFYFRINYASETLEANLDDGEGWSAVRNPITISAVMLHPDRIIRKPPFTEEEVAFLRHIESVFPGSSVKKIADSALVIEADKRGKWALPAELLPSLRPGQSVALEDIIGGAE